ncbi:MAG: DNA recombination protein RmuC [Rickettsiales bacterium]|nr:DNA recombination protein RmuC [Rickettsiales bacterium]|tara:strand:+ start:533 stop:2041 length:1509 start_codon:yes stop_codon:yes gene_type:complete
MDILSIFTAEFFYGLGLGALIFGGGVYLLTGRKSDGALRDDIIRKDTKIETLDEQLRIYKHDMALRDEKLESLTAQQAKLQADLENEKKKVESQLETVEKAKQELSNMFKAVGQEALQANNKAFLDLAKENLEKMNVKSSETLESKKKAIEEILKPVSSSLEKMDEKITLLEKARHGAYEGLKQHLSHMAEDQVKLRRETAQLVQALRSPSTKGRWGEIHLRNTVKMAGMMDHVDFVEQDSFRDEGQLKKPDMIIKMPGGQKVIVDAKAPIDAYYDCLEDDISAIEREERMTRLARLVRDHIKGLSSKAYWDQFESPEFVIMFLPNEGVFSAAVEKDPGLLEYGVEQKVIPASPTTLIALLRAVAYGWQQEKIAENAREISDLGAELYKRLSSFGGHLQSLGRGLNTALNNYNKAIGSLERSVLPTARKFQDLHVMSKPTDLPDLEQIDQQTRLLNAPEFDNEADDIALDDDSETSKKQDDVSDDTNEESNEDLDKILNQAS